MRNIFRMSVVCISLAAGVANAADYLVRFDAIGQEQEQFLSQHGGKLALVSKEGVLFKWTTNHENAMEVATWEPSVRYIQPNFKIGLLKNPSIEANRAAIQKAIANNQLDLSTMAAGDLADNPAINKPPTQGKGSDPMFGKAWGMGQIGAGNAMTRSAAGKGIIVAVTDTGVDYNHEDLIANMWRNPGEIPDNNIDVGSPGTELEFAL